MTVADPVPTLTTWLGGQSRLEELTARFYAKVPPDPALSAVFAGMDSHHAQHVAAFVMEVFQGGRPYTKQVGSNAQMIAKHMGRNLTEAQRKRWIAIMMETVD